ncbi:MAG: hypothetical protein AB1817_20280, partial [Chloroflexota bacterium]
FEKYGIQRTVRDVLQIAGRVQVNAIGRIEQITLNQNHPLAATVRMAFVMSLASDDLSVNLGKI